jgi:putative ABC transport system permease protein
MITDLRQAFRTLRKSPGFTALVIVVLAVGIGANTAIFSIVDGVLLKPLPFANASRLVAVTTTLKGEPDDTAYLDFVDWRAQTKTLERLAAYTGAAATLTGTEGPALSVPIAVVTSDLMPMLGVRPALGRVFLPDDDKKGAPRTVILSDDLWAKRFNRDRGIVGRHIVIDTEPFEVVGVMSPEFQFPIDAEDPVQLWTPVYASRFAASWADQRGASFLKSIGLLKPGLAPETAQAELVPIEDRIDKDSGRTGARSVTVHPFQDVLVEDYRLGLLVLLCAVGSVLLIACANVANLLLARGSVRRRELAVRAALGASRLRILRQLIVESTLLAVAGGVFGAVVAVWVVELLVRFSPLMIPRLHAVHVDMKALSFAAAISLITGVVSGIAPAFQLSRANGDDALRATERGGTARGARTRQLLVISEVALSLVLLTSAGLLVRSLVRLQQVSPGFRTERSVAMQLLLPDASYPKADHMRRFVHQLQTELQALPGVSAVMMTTTLPLSGNDIGVGYVVEDHPIPASQRSPASFFAVGPTYFSAMGIPLVEGRGFTERDDERAPGVLVINRALAKKYWPGQSPIGKRIKIGYQNTGMREVVGVVDDVKQRQLSEAAVAQIYAPFDQTPWPFVTAIVRTNAAPESAFGSMRAALARVDPMLGAGDLKTLDQYVARSIATPRFTTYIVGAFATLALLLAGFGLFSVMAYSVAQRRRELGIRVALGAEPRDIRSLVLGQAVRLGVAGLGIGLVGAFAATRVIESLLFGVTAHDPTTFAAVSAALMLVLVGAAYVPARRAMRVDPIVSLRTE